MEEKSSMYPKIDVQHEQQNNIAPPPSYNQTFANNQGQGPAIGSFQQVPPGESMQQHQVIIQQPPVYISQGIPPLGPNPVNATCPNCGQREPTNVIYENGTKTHIMALVLCLFGLCCCACIPYCVDSCRNANHYCRHCNQFMGTYGNNNC